MKGMSSKDWLGSSKYYTEIAWVLVWGLKTGKRGIIISYSTSGFVKDFFHSWQLLISLVIEDGNISLEYHE